MPRISRLLLILSSVVVLCLPGQVAFADGRDATGTGTERVSRDGTGRLLAAATRRSGRTGSTGRSSGTSRRNGRSRRNGGNGRASGTGRAAGNNRNRARTTTRSTTTRSTGTRSTTTRGNRSTRTSTTTPAPTTTIQPVPLWNTRDSSVPADPGVISEADLEPVFRVEAAKKAVALIQAGQYLAARDMLLSNAELVAGDHQQESRFLLAWACYKGGDWLCIESITLGLERGLPDVADYVAFMRATGLSETGRTDEALTMLGGITSPSPLFRDAVKMQAGILVASGRDEQAAELLSEYLNDRTVDTGIVGDLAEALLSSGKRERVIAELRNASVRASGNGGSGLRGLLSRLGIAPETGGRGVMDRAWNQLNAHDNTRALTTVSSMLNSGNDAVRCEALEISARANTKLRNHDKAILSFRSLVEKCAAHRDMPSILFLAIRSAYRTNDPATGDRWTERLARDYPAASFNDDIAVMRARMAIDDGKHDQAMRILEDSVRRWPNGDMADESRWLLAWASISGHNWSEAVKRLELGETLAVDKVIYASKFAYWHARALQRSGHQADAVRAYGRCAMKWPMSFYAVMSLNRLADISGKTPDDVLARLVAESAGRPGVTGQPFLRLGNGSLPTHGPAARALWFSRIGLRDLALRELDTAPAGDDAAAWLKSLFQNMTGEFTSSHRMAKDRLAGSSFWPTPASAGYYRLAYPRPFAAEVGAAAAESRVDPLLIWAVMREESAFVSGVESWANATGLMQLIMPTAKSMANSLGISVDKESLREPARNVRLGAAYLRKLLDRFGNPILAIPGYNAGGGAISRWLGESHTTQVDEFVESIQASEAREYARKVFESYAAYSYLYGERPYHVSRVIFTVPD